MSWNESIIVSPFRAMDDGSQDHLFCQEWEWKDAGGRAESSERRAVEDWWWAFGFWRIRTWWCVEHRASSIEHQAFVPGQKCFLSDHNLTRGVVASAE